jgi:DNA-binding FadR family transcriptional regulator
VREALGRLEAMGIVEIKAGLHGGARIAQGNLDKYAEALAIQLKLVGVMEEEMFDAQMAVESLGVELAAQKASPEDIHHLIAILDEAETLQDNQVEFTKKLLSFHLALVETSRNRVLVAQMQAFIDVQYTTYLPWTTPTISRQVLKRHRALVGKIQQGDADGAREMIVNHLKRVRKRVLDHFKSGTVSETE